MINLLLGAPGGGKSYEAVVYHILPALAQGRKIITNLPLNIERFAQIDATYPALIEIRTATRAARPEVDWQKAEAMYKKFGIAHKSSYFLAVAFAHAEDYGDSWRHPVTGAGPLYVIDECHIPLPVKGTPIKVEEWYSLHRHESADVLLITQSYGKVNRAIRDLVQVVYRVRKNTIFGSSTSYTRKVQDGLRGEVVNTSVRKYEKKYFNLYRSHTRGGGAELAAQDVRPIWLHWSFVGAALLLVVAVWMGFQGYLNPFRSAEQVRAKVEATKAAAAPQRVATVVPLRDTPPPPAPAPAPAPAVPDQGKALPFGRVQLHISGYVVSESTGRSLHHFTASQNGQAVFNLTAQELRSAGYKLEPLGPCAVRVQFDQWEQYVICDSPRVGVGGVVSRVAQETSL